MKKLQKRTHKYGISGKSSYLCSVIPRRPCFTHTSGFVFLYTLRIDYTATLLSGIKFTWVVYDYRPVLDCKGNKNI